MGKALEAITKPIGTILGGGTKIQRIEAPTPMPTPDDDAVNAARRRRLAADQARSGRVSTLLSGGGERTTLGG